VTTAKRQDAGAAVGGLFNRPSATGGLAGAARAAEPPGSGPAPAGRSAPASSRQGVSALVAAESRVRLGVELTEHKARAQSAATTSGGERCTTAKRM
jgi:hypothetical protein